jgi:acetyltransferase
MTPVTAPGMELERIAIRPIRPDDDRRLARLYERMSPVNRYRRFLSATPRVPADRLQHLVDVDGERHVALVALVDDEVIAAARYVRLRSDATLAEIAVEVDDAWHRRGIARFLLGRLTDHARKDGIATFTAEIGGENRPAVALVRAVWPHTRFSLSDAVFTAIVTLDADHALQPAA